MRINENALFAYADSIRTAADHILEAPKERWGAKEEWSEKPDAEPKPGAFVPSGFPRLDALIEALPINWHYDAPYPSNKVNGAVMLMRHFSPEDSRIPAEITKGGIVVIEMPDKERFGSDNGYAAALAHELVHWSEMHDPSAPISAGLSAEERLSKAKDTKVEPAYIVEELTAELGAAMLLELCEVPQAIDDRAQYLSGYFNAVPPVFRDIAFKMAKERALKAVKNLVTDAESRGAALA